MPRCASLSTIVVVMVGDSWGVDDPTGQGNDHYTLFCAEFQRQNPGKTVHFVNRAIGGATWEWLAGVAGAFPDWYSNHALSWLSYVQSVSVDGLGTVTPDLVVIWQTGGNDVGTGGGVHRNNVAAVINTIRSWTTSNGLPPDVMLLAAKDNTTEDWSTGSREYYVLGEEYNVGLHRSLARLNGYGLIDIDTHSRFMVNGWAPDRMVFRQVQPPIAGTPTATAPMDLRYLTRDFFVALKLGTGGQTGTSFWSTAGKLAISLSAKGDNRLWFGIDGSNNLQVCAVTWGLPVTTTVSITNGAAALTTSGQTSVNIGSATSIATTPAFILSSSNSNYSSGMLGKCYWESGRQYGSTDYRTYVMGYTNTQIIFGADGTTSASAGATAYYGGQMFIASDATAAADCIVAGAGGTTHMLTGASSLVSKCSSYTSRTQMTLADNASATLTTSSRVMFLGAIAVQPTYDRAVTAGSDAGANPVLTVQKRGNHIRVGYLSGGASLTDIANALKTAYIVWEGDVECYGGPYIPKIWADASVTVTPVAMWVGERDIRQTAYTQRDINGTGGGVVSWPFGGDSGHLSHLGLLLTEEVLARQNLCTGIPTTAGKLVTKAVTANGSIGVVPINAVVTRIIVENTTANAVTGGIDIGTTAGGTDVVSAQTVGANGLVVIQPSTLLKQYFSRTATQTLYIAAHTAWNSASLNIRVEYDQ